MPKWSAKDKRQYEHIKDSSLEGGKSEDTAEEIVARTVNKRRRQEGRSGVELYVKDWGVGRPLVLIHGWSLSADSWDDVAVSLTNAGFRTIAYDRRGFGRSSQPWDGYNYDTLSDDLALDSRTNAA